jgi:hypothetical protein
LVIELDGGQHADATQAAYDADRTAFLEAAGFRVLRFWNTEVLQNLSGVLERIVAVLAERTLLTPHPDLPPRGGKGRANRLSLYAVSTSHPVLFQTGGKAWFEQALL